MRFAVRLALENLRRSADDMAYHGDNECTWQDIDHWLDMVEDEIRRLERTGMTPDRRNGSVTDQL